MGHYHGKLVEPELGSPLDAALSQRDRGTLSMVRAALARGDTLLAYQPVMRADGAGIVFYEGLIRLLDETGRVIPARDFIDVVEEQDLGRQIDCASLRLGLAALKASPTLRLSINMSARSIGYPDWMNTLHRAVRFQPETLNRLILEITETSAMQMPEIVQAFMETLQDKGITFALDDFGAGQTAFRHLRRFCFDILKIDGQFSRNVDTDPDNQVLCAALISLGRHFDMIIVAEAVETAGEAAWLAKAGLHCLQGYFFAVPSITPPWAHAGPPS
jgi:EAL domain-containing protein (putative c-di-GMP-specific phosphodiesterase class I)